MSFFVLLVSIVFGSFSSAFVTLPTPARSLLRSLGRCGNGPCRNPMTRASGASLMVKEQADSVPLPLAAGLELALNDLIGKIYSILKTQEQISGRKFAPIESRFIDMTKKYDISKSGAIELGEFRELVSDGIAWRSLLLPQSTASGSFKTPTRPEIEEIFGNFDVDRSGSLSTRELIKALSALGLQVEKVEQDLPKDAITLKGTDQAYWTPASRRGSDLPISLKPWGAPLEALFQDDFGAVKTMVLFNAIKLADGAYGQFQQIVAGTWQGAPPNIKGFIPRLLKITAALRLMEQHYTICAAWEEDGDSSFLKEAYNDAKEEVSILMLRLAQLMFLLVQREAKVPLKGNEKSHLESVLTPLGVEITPGMDYGGLAKKLDEDGLSQRMWQGNLLDELDVGAKDFAAYFRLRKSSKRDLKAFEQSCYGQAVEKQMKTVLKNKGKSGKDDLVLAELQALQALPC